MKRHANRDAFRPLNHPDAFRVPLHHNFVAIPVEGFGSAPCLGVHAGVVQGGRLSPGDEVLLAN
jgi:hypothetical protein